MLGSNIANIFLILGITAIISPIVLTKNTRFFDLPVVILTSLIFLLFVSDRLFDGATRNMIGRIDGIVLFLMAIAYTLYSLKHHNFTPDESEEVEIIHS